MTGRASAEQRALEQYLPARTQDKSELELIEKSEGRSPSSATGR